MDPVSYNPVARILPPEEWGRVPEFAGFPPEHSIVVVVEDGGPGGAILAQWGALTTVHVEGLQVVEGARGHAGVAAALLRTMVGELLSRGVKEVLTQSASPEVDALVQSAGGHQVPGTTWVLPLTEPPS